MAVTTDSKTYPQFTASSSERSRGDSFGGLDAFRFGGAVQNRPACVSGVEKTENGVILTLKTSARRAVLSYTHETSLYLYENAEATVGEVYLRIEFWTNGIFRVALSKDKEPSDRFASIPEDMRMLVAKPERVDLSLNRDEGRIILSTDTVTIRIDESTAATEACFADGKVFYSRLIQEMFTAAVYDLALAEADGKYACFEALELENDEVIYGLGERFDSVVRNGRTVDFRNTIIIMTSNAGARDMSRASIGFGSQLQGAGAVNEAVEKAFSPEFRNRLDAIIPFNPLSLDVAESIVKKEVKKLALRLAAQKVELVVEDDCVAFLAEEGYSPLYGARNIARVVDAQITTPLVDEILFGPLAAGGRVSCSIADKDGKKQVTLEYRDLS